MTMHVKSRLLNGAAKAGRAPEIKDNSALMAEIKKNVDDFMTGFNEFKSTNDARLKSIEKTGAADPLIDAKLAKIEKSLEKGEELSAKLVKLENEQKASKEEKSELELQIAKLEAKFGRPGAGSPEEKSAALKCLVNDWGRAAANAIIVGVHNLSDAQRKSLDQIAAEHKSLNVTSDTAGGFLAPTEYVREIIKGVTDATPARQLARIRSTTSKSMQFAKRTGQFAARRVSEQGPRTETPGLTYGGEEVTLPEMYAIIDMSNQLIEDAAFDMAAEISAEANEQFAIKEGQEFISGTGVGEMEGILVNAAIQESVSGSAAVITGDGLLTLKYGIKAGYARNATFVFNRTTLGAIRKLKDNNGQYLWMPGLANGTPNTIDGDPYAECTDMPNVAANAYPVAYGDFRRGYLIGDRLALTLVRDPFTQASNGNVRFLLRRRVGGQVVLADAIRKLKIAA